MDIDEVIENPDNLSGVAIIGMAGRFPGANNLTAFWKNLCDGRDCISRFATPELEDTFSAEERARPDFVAARPILEDVDLFDASYFGFRPREASLIDPQHRIFLQVACDAFEDAGYDPKGLGGQAIGVYAGCSLNTYLLRHVLSNSAKSQQFTNDYQVGSYETLVGALADTLATRISYKLDLRGPSMTVATACSTSLTAIAQAVQAVLTYQCDLALAGGVSITFPQRRGYFAQEGGMASLDGVCRPFDAQANGTVFGSGAGAVLLKRLEDAVADGDHIYAVIKGVAINNDGASKIGFTAPSVEPQAEVIATAQAMADFDPASVGYVECHGTATPLGDPIEVAALAKAFGQAGDRKTCVLGSVKGNVGHLDAAAGVTALIKAALAVERGVIPPTVNYSAPNPLLELERTPFVVSGTTMDWPQNGKQRRAGVTSLGVGGTNVHVCLEQAPHVNNDSGTERPEALVTLSARSVESLAAAKAQLADFLFDNPDTVFADVAHSLSLRPSYSERCSVVAQSVDDLRVKLARPAAPFTTAQTTGRPVIMMFPGQGTQYPGMGFALYRDEPVFKAAMDDCARHLVPHLGLDLRTLIYPTSNDDEAENADKIRQTILAQPAIFSVAYATAQLWLSRSIKPAAMIGHSVGEFVAATIAGVLSLEDATKFIALRGREMQSVASGSMLAVRLPEADLRGILPVGVDIAAINGPSMTVVAGQAEAIAELEPLLAARSVLHKRIHTSHAFHSWMMEPVLAPLSSAMSGIARAQPSIPYISCVSGDWISDADIFNDGYWSRHCREAVRFSTGVTTLLEKFADPILLEAGPGSSLVALARQCAPKRKDLMLLATLPDPAADVTSTETFLTAVGQLWGTGVPVDRAHASRGRRISLPTTPFERRRHWVEAAPDDVQQLQPLPSTPLVTVTPPEIEIAAQGTVSQMTLQSTERQGHDIAALSSKIAELLDSLSGESLTPSDFETPFLELGFDSLFMAQVATQLQKKFAIKITFRQLLNDVPTISAVANYVAKLLPAPSPAPVVHAAPMAAPAAVAGPAAPIGAVALPQAVPTQLAVMAGLPTNSSGLQQLMREQLAVMQNLFAQQNQLLLQGTAVASFASAPIDVPVASAVPADAPKAAPMPALEAAAEPAAPSRHDLYRASPGAGSDEMTEGQSAFLKTLITRYEAQTKGSKQLTQQRRGVLADPRSAAAFRAEWKEIVYPIVAQRSKGSRIWDVDGNEYIDLVNGYGQTFFGHAPDFVLDAISEQMKEGFAIGPQSPLAGEVAQMFAEMTGNERVTFCNTGSEAVMAAMRVARTVTGRDRIVMFDGSYHGQFDEVLVKGKSRAGADPSGLPIAPGIPLESVGNIVVLPYNKPESLEWIRANSQDIAAVLVETVQSRHPNLQPMEFLKSLRAITQEVGTALVFDEIVTGFRVHPGGMQMLTGIRADMATYGKVVGGGMPIGVLAGKAEFMDALDGGAWQYGDESVPEVAPTFFAGTFVRHPLVLAAARAVLLRLKAEGPQLQERLQTRTVALASRLNAALGVRGIASRAETFSNWFWLTLAGEGRLASLFFHHMRLLGVHVQEGFPCFLTTEHSDADIEQIYASFVETLDALQAAGILAGTAGVVEKPAVAGLVSHLSELPAASPSLVPLTEPQMEIWLSAQMGDDQSCAFNESVTLSLKGSLDKRALFQAINDVFVRHDVLRARFAADGSGMLIEPDFIPAIATHDWSNEAIKTRGELFKSLLDAEARTPLDLVSAPSSRVHLVAFGADEHALVLTAHHIVCDGWSVNVIVQDLAELYSALVEGRPHSLGDAPSFAARALAGVDSDGSDETYWRQTFAVAPSPLELPGDRARPAAKSYAGATFTSQIDAGLYKAVKKAGAKRGATLFVTLLGAFQILLGRLAGSNEVVVDVPMAGQALGDDDGPGVVGHSVNLLPIRANWDKNATVADLLKSVARMVMDARDNQRCTLGTIVRQLNLPRTPNRLPLSDLQFNLERLSQPADFGSLKVALTPNPKAFVNFDMFLNITESDAGLRLDIDYSTDLFDRSTIERWVGHLTQVLTAVVDDIDQRIAAVPLLSAAQYDAMIVAVNATASPIAEHKTFADLFEVQAARNPDAIAVVCGLESRSYAQLANRSDRIAARLRELVCGGGRVGIMMERSCDLPASMLAAAKAGFAFVPLDPHLPAARLARIISRSNLIAMITDGQSSIDASVPIINIGATGRDLGSAQLPGRTGEAETAYVIFTSGSTGVPKGVEVGHVALTNLLTAMAQRPGLSKADTLVAVTTVSFDISILELLLPLVVGGKLIIASRDDAIDGFALQSLVLKEKATVLQATPATWGMLVEVGFEAPAGFKMLCGGEALTRALADRLLVGRGELWNMYGPTETTIWSSTSRILNDGRDIGIGNPIANTQMYVLDSEGRPALPGAVGELVISGAGVARGYFGDPELTAEKFLPHWQAGDAKQRMYRTGDLARQSSSGDIYLLGRADHQVKIKGFRIELGEIEAALVQISGISQAVVALKTVNGKAPRLVAYYTTERGIAVPEPEVIGLTLNASLPDYMVPSSYEHLPSLPLTQAGKVDRQALPEPTSEISVKRQDLVNLTTSWQQAMGDIWKEVLVLDAVGATDDVLSLGADSIQLFQIVARARRAGIMLAAKDLLAHRTIASLSEAFEHLERYAPAKETKRVLPVLADFRRRA